MKREPFTSRFAIIFIALGAVAAVTMVAKFSDFGEKPVPNFSIPWNGQRTMDDIKTQVDAGPRALGTPGHAAVIDFITGELVKTPAQVTHQTWSILASDGAKFDMTNIVARFDPENPRRVLLGTHYDSIIRAYRDMKKPNDYMPGANNSASGVALLLETARALSGPQKVPVGVDMVFFDGEEGPHSLGAGDPDWMALGSQHFAAHLDETYSSRKPEQAIIFDMVCYRDAKLRPELFSLVHARKNIENFWHIGTATAPEIFTDEPTSKTISDDQVALSRADIPAFLVIGFEYEPWFNTTQDTIDKCTPQIMEGLGKTLLTYLYMQ